jgi:hypothetical protein
MIRTVALSCVLSFVIVAAWAAQVVCYQEQTMRADPLAPITFTVASTPVQD